MFKNYLTIALRNLNKNRFYTLINVAGLTVGATACFIIFLFIQFELSYDKFNVNADRIVRVDWELLFGENHSYKAALTPPMAEVLVSDYPEVEAAARLTFQGASQFKHKDESIVESQVVYADNDLFKIFTLPFVSGNPENALKEPNSMVVTETYARQIFPNEDALGKSLVKDNHTLYTITGIIKDIPENSHFRFQIFLSMEGLEESKNGNWIGGPYNTYLLLRRGVDSKALESKLPGIVDKYVIPHAAAVLGSSFMEEFKKAGNRLTLHLRPLTDIHLYSHLQNEIGSNGDVRYVLLLSAIAILILIIACINFMNLSTARSAHRAREIGIRKVMGSSRLSLAIQFLMESVILCSMSFIIAIGATDILLPLFNEIAGANLTFPSIDLSLLLIIVSTILVVGILAGLYPSIVLSSFQAVKVLKGNFATGKRSFLRSGLVVFQFAVSIFLMICTIALFQQMSFIQNRKIGFNKEQVILLKDVDNVGDRLHVIRDEIKKTTLIKDGTISSYFPGPGSARKTPLAWKFGATPSPENSSNLEKWTVDHHYINTLEIRIIQGRNFSPDFPTDSSAVILNETAVRKLSLSGNPIGQKIALLHENEDGSQDGSRVDTWTIVGIAEDFNFESLRENVAPLGLFFGVKSHGIMAFRYESGNTQKVIEAIEFNWKRLAPGEVFHYSFLDQDFQKMYASEKKLNRIFVLFSGLAIIIACLGLFALTAFTAEQRTKEIGIRKILGASLQSIVILLSKEFGKLIILAFILAAIPAAYAIYIYLQQYAYKVEIGLWIYVLAGMVSFLLAFFTMGFQSIKVANGNPVNTLRSE